MAFVKPSERPNNYTVAYSVCERSVTGLLEALITAIYRRQHFFLFLQYQRVYERVCCTGHWSSLPPAILDLTYPHDKNSCWFSFSKGKGQELHARACICMEMNPRGLDFNPTTTSFQGRILCWGWLWTNKKQRKPRESWDLSMVSHRITYLASEWTCAGMKLMCFCVYMCRCYRQWTEQESCSTGRQDTQEAGRPPVCKGVELQNMVDLQVQSFWLLFSRPWRLCLCYAWGGRRRR